MAQKVKLHRRRKAGSSLIEEYVAVQRGRWQANNRREAELRVQIRAL